MNLYTLDVIFWLPSHYANNSTQAVVTISHLNIKDEKDITDVFEKVKKISFVRRGNEAVLFIGLKSDQDESIEPLHYLGDYVSDISWMKGYHLESKSFESILKQLGYKPITNDHNVVIGFDGAIVELASAVERP